MSRAHKTLIIMLVALLGLWGCAEGNLPQQNTVMMERVKTLEGKISKLEEECKALTAARDQVRKKLAESEEQRIKHNQQAEQQQQQFAAVARERDEFRQQLSARTTEREALQSQFEQFRKGVRSLLIQADSAAAGLVTPPAVSSGEAPAVEKPS